MDKQTHDVAIGLVLLLAVLPVAAVAGHPDERLLDGIPLRLIGPSSPSGRVWQVVGVPAEPKTFYVCTAQGGVWRTTNFGATLEQVFDEENGASCGAVAIAPSDAHQIWVADIAPLEQLEAALERRAFLFDVKPVVAYNLRHTYGVTIEELDGDLFFRGKNPPYGAVITYSLRNAAPGDRSARADGGGTPATPARRAWHLHRDARGRRRILVAADRGSSRA